MRASPLPPPPPPPGTAALRTRPSRLAISVYPPFAYDATGGGGVAAVTKGQDGGRLGLAFDAATVAIPPLDWRTGRWLGVPLPPFLRIDIVPLRLEVRERREERGGEKHRVDARRDHPPPAAT